MQKVEEEDFYSLLDGDSVFFSIRSGILIVHDTDFGMGMIMITQGFRSLNPTWLIPVGTNAKLLPLNPKAC